MIANTAFLAAVTTFLIVAWLAGELSYLSDYKTALFRLHGMQLEQGGLVCTQVAQLARKPGDDQESGDRRKEGRVRNHRPASSNA